MIVAHEVGGVCEVHAARPGKDGSCKFEEWREGVTVTGRYALQAAGELRWSYPAQWLMLQACGRGYAALPFRKGRKTGRVAVIEGGLCLESACAWFCNAADTCSDIDLLGGEDDVPRRRRRG